MNAHKHKHTSVSRSCLRVITASKMLHPRAKASSTALTFWFKSLDNSVCPVFNSCSEDWIDAFTRAFSCIPQQTIIYTKTTLADTFLGFHRMKTQKRLNWFCNRSRHRPKIDQNTRWRHVGVQSEGERQREGEVVGVGEGEREKKLTPHHNMYQHVCAGAKSSLHEANFSYLIRILSISCILIPFNNLRVSCVWVFFVWVVVPEIAATMIHYWFKLPNPHRLKARVFERRGNVAGLHLNTHIPAE